MNGKGKACFVAGALPGETVRWKRTKSHRSYDEGEMVEIIEASPDRITPKCQYIQKCGGCELQHLESSAQLAAKEGQLKRAFEREGIEPESWLPPLAGNPWEYRRRTRLAVAYAGKRTIVGYRERAGHKLVEVENCAVLAPALNKLLPFLEDLATALKPFGLNQIELVTGDQNDQEQSAICLSVKRIPSDAVLEPFKTFFAAKYIQLWVRQGRKAPEPQSEYAPLQTALVDDLTMEFTPAQFVQANAEMNQKMVAQAMALLDVQPEHKALDLFCGAGNFSLPIAKKAKKTVGVEGLSELIMQADLNAKRQGLKNTDFRLADLSKDNVMTARKFPKGSFDRILLDPPRTGAINLMPAVAHIGASRVVYVSCHPATLVRDAKMLVEGGYRLTKVGVIDMFPQTTHLEAIALFQR